MANKPLYGTHNEAFYSASEIPAYAGNPLIEALPPLQSRAILIEQLAHYPTFSPTDREKPEHIRLHLVSCLRDMYQPFNKSVSIAQTIDEMIRAGYQGRNPLSHTFWKDNEQRVRGMAINYMARPAITSTASGMGIIGLPGMGKTVIQNRTLLRYPQIIFHKEYNGQQFPFQQLVWMKQDIPHDSSIRGFCFQYFQAYDFILGTNYYGIYTRNGRATVDEMIPRMARVASIHGQGIQMLDELQNINIVKSGGAEKLLQFFVNFANIVGVPLVFTGTPEALPFLKGTLHMIRRVEDRGYYSWKRMKFEDTEWSLLCEKLWDYQYVRFPVTLSESMKRGLFEASQGITSYAVGIFLDAQKWAIQNGAETLSERMFNDVAQELRGLSSEVRFALGISDVEAARLVDDINDTNTDVPKLPPPKHIQQMKEQNASKQSNIAFAEGLLENSLVHIVERGKEGAISAYEALVQAGHISSPQEFLEVGAL